jgi:hypothetical protein
MTEESRIDPAGGREAGALPTPAEIEQTFTSLGLLGTSTTGYQYFTPVQPTTPRQFFEVTRSNYTSPRVS